jgi:ATP-binding cassette subfamily B protein
VVAAIVISVTSNLFSLLGPLLLGKAIGVIGDAAGGVDFKAVVFYCALLAFFYVISSVMSYILSVMMIKLSQQMTKRMRKDIFDSVTELSVAFFDRHQAGDIISHISYDVDRVNASLSNDLVQIVSSLITVVGSFIMMLSISPPLVITYAATLPVSFLLARYMGKKVRPMFHERSVKLGELNGYAEEIIGGHKTIRAYRKENYFASLFKDKNRIAVDAHYIAEYNASFVGPCMMMINNAAMALISVFGSLFYIYGGLALEGLAAFILYSRKFSGPITEIANISSELQSALSAAERVFALIDEPREAADADKAQPLVTTGGEVDFTNVRFGYDDESPVIRNLNLNIPKGSLVAVAGPTGAGKTTIINLLMRFYDPQKGEIKIDGREIREVTRKSLRRGFAMILQDSWLFHGTVFENIAYGRADRGDVAMDEVVAAAKAAQIHNYINSLPDGYNTILSENGTNISQGQKQLISIARAMMSQADMLIFDEATSNVDTWTEKKIQSAMTRLMRGKDGGGKTCFVIAHRLSAIRDADIILVVKDGDIAERGAHKELIELGGVYAGLYKSQFS